MKHHKHMRYYLRKLIQHSRRPCGPHRFNRLMRYKEALRRRLEAERVAG